MVTFTQFLFDALSLGGFYALVALAIGLIFGIMRLINFAHGDYITIGAYSLIVPSASVAPALLLGAMPAAIMILGVTLTCVVLALLTERFAFRPLRQTSPATLLISSFAVSYFLQNLLMIIHTGRPKSVPIGGDLIQAVEFLGVRVSGSRLLTIGVTLVLFVALALFLRLTSLGIQMRAAAENFQMARLLGIRANRVIAAAFALSGIIAAATSLLIVVQSGSVNIRMGIAPVLIGFFATVIGGMGSLLGATLGGFLVGIITVALQTYLPADLRPMRDAFVYLAVILILLFRPQGLIVTNAAKERV